MCLNVAAAVSWGVGEAVKVEEIQVDPPKSSEVRIKMLCASLCHTDILCCNGLPVVSALPLFILSLSLSDLYMTHSLSLSLSLCFLFCFSAFIPSNSWT